MSINIELLLERQRGDGPSSRRIVHIEDAADAIRNIPEGTLIRRVSIVEHKVVDRRQFAATAKDEIVDYIKKATLLAENGLLDRINDPASQLFLDRIELREELSE